MNTSAFIAVVRYTMLAGAVYDALFAVVILAAPARLAGILGLPMPDQEIYLRFCGVFLVALALFYLQPWLYPGRYLGNVAAAAAARLGGAIFMIASVLLYRQPRVFLLLGAGDLGFAALHYLSLVPFAGAKVWRLAGVDLSPRAAGGR